MKFGGTSVADASCIAKVADIVRAAVHESSVAVVVSAMSGVTSKLVEAAAQSEAGNHRGVAIVLEELRERHASAANALIHSIEKRRARQSQDARSSLKQLAISVRTLSRDAS